MLSLTQPSLIHGQPLAGQRQAATAFKAPAAAAPRRWRHCAAAPSAVYTPTTTTTGAAAPAVPSISGATYRQSPEQLAAQVARKEEELARLFEPGKPQPRAAVVAGLRKEVAALRAQLQAELGIVGEAAAAVAADFPTATTTVLESVVASAGSAGGDIRGSVRVLEALKMVEAALSVSRRAEEQLSVADLSAEEQAELVRLHDENAALKIKLDALLARQAQLQVLWDKHVGKSNIVSGNGAGGGYAPSQYAPRVQTRRPVAQPAPFSAYTP